MGTGNPKFSIIIPSHNGEAHISKALSSVTDQSFKDYELIVVCDACTDNTGSIAEQHDAKIVTVNHSLDGLARNAGLDQAAGEWILFLDDDDWFMHEHVLHMLAKTVGGLNEDILNFSFIWKGIGYCKQEPSMLYKMAWCRCYRHEFIKDLRFNSASYGSDNDFFARLFNMKPVTAFWDMPMYYYNYMRQGSLTERKSHGE